MRVLLCLILLTSCLSPKFDLAYELSRVTKIDFNEQYLNGKEIVLPRNNWVSLMQFSKYCVFYKTPFKNDSGILKIVRRSSRCDFSDDAVFEEERISSLSLKLFTSRNITLEFNINDENRVFPLLNYKVQKKYQAFDNQLKHSFFDNVFVDMEGIKDVEKLKDGVLCHGVNIECSDVVDYRCDQCESGSYEVVDFNCPQGGSKYCGQDKCGNKNQPACPRGYKTLDSKLPTLCFEGSPAGFCKPGLSTFCSDDGILICL